MPRADAFGVRPLWMTFLNHTESPLIAGMRPWRPRSGLDCCQDFVSTQQ
jgi:hypothetical protein